jgi:hypothetical protein
MLVEKLMSGLYMGECARRLLLSFARNAQLFGGHVPGPLAEKGSFTTAGKDWYIHSICGCALVKRHWRIELSSFRADCVMGRRPDARIRANSYAMLSLQAVGADGFIPSCLQKPAAPVPALPVHYRFTGPLPSTVVPFHACVRHRPR